MVGLGGLDDGDRLVVEVAERSLEELGPGDVVGVEDQEDLGVGLPEPEV